MDTLAALADPTRRRILELLADGEVAAGELSDEFTVSRPGSWDDYYPSLQDAYALPS